MWSCADADDNFLPMPGCCFSSGRLLWGCDPSIGNCRQVSEAGRRWRGLLSEEDQDQDSKQDDPLNWWLKVPFPCFIITTIVEWCRTQRFQRWQWNKKSFFAASSQPFITLNVWLQFTLSYNAQIDLDQSYQSINRKLQRTIVNCASTKQNYWFSISSKFLTLAWNFAFLGNTETGIEVEQSFWGESF